MISKILSIYFSKTTNYFRWFILAAIIIFSFALMLSVSFQESATMDELAHIPAGYSYVKYFDFRLNPEHPPLVKALAAFPLLSQNLNFPIESFGWQKNVNDQWVIGTQFLYESGNDADKIIRWSRLGPMLLVLILAIFIYIWSKELIGRWWALLPAFLFSFSPTILTHGHYVTTDIGAAIGIFIATYYFIKFLSKPSRENLVFAGLTFGIAQLMKFSAVLLVPFFIFLIAVFYFWKIYNERQKFFSYALRYAGWLASIFFIGYVLVYAAYFLFTFNYPIDKQISDTQFILSSFDSPLAKIDIWMAGNKILRPLGEYFLGVLMVMQRSSGGNTGYFIGEVSAAGWWYYFPTLFILKEPIPSLILILLAFLFGIWHIIKRLKNENLKLKIFNDYLGLHFSEFAMISFVIFYWLYSMKSPLNIGIRHILPTLPFIYILTASGIKKWINNSTLQTKDFASLLTSYAVNLIKISIKGIFIMILLAWYLFETLFNYPYYLSYFNEFKGGTKNGYQYAVDSNYDWGQDLKRLEKFTEENNIQKIAIDYFGGGNPKYYLNNKTEYWSSMKGNPKYEGIEWLAVSINTLQNASGKLHPGQQRNPEDEYLWLSSSRDLYKPDAKAGTSIFIYKL